MSQSQSILPQRKFAYCKDPLQFEPPREIQIQKLETDFISLLLKLSVLRANGKRFEQYPRAPTSNAMKSKVHLATSQMAFKG